MGHKPFQRFRVLCPRGRLWPFTPAPELAGHFLGCFQQGAEQCARPPWQLYRKTAKADGRNRAVVVPEEGSGQPVDRGPVPNAVLIEKYLADLL